MLYGEPLALPNPSVHMRSVKSSITKFTAAWSTRSKKSMNGSCCIFLA